MRREGVTLIVAGALSVVLGLGACANQGATEAPEAPAETQTEEAQAEDTQAAESEGTESPVKTASLAAEAPTPEADQRAEDKQVPDTADVQAEPAAEEASPEEQPAEEASDEEVVEVSDLILSQYSYTIADGYVDLAFAITNPNADYAPELVTVHIVGRAPNGSISFSNDWHLSTTLPGATTYWSGIAGNGYVGNSDSVEVTLSVEEGLWYETTEFSDFYLIDNLRTFVNDEGRLVTTGEITLLRDAELQGYGDVRTPLLVAVMRDANDNIVGGYNALMRSVLRVGVPVGFEIDSAYDNPNCRFVEVTANPW